jgi:hypothetical protein
VRVVSSSAPKLSASTEKSISNGDPLMPLPVLVERPEGSWVCRELLDLHRLLVDPHATGT